MRSVLATVGLPPSRNGAAVDQDVSGHIAASRDAIAGGVTKHRQHAGAGQKAGCNRHGLSPLESLAAAQMRVSCGSARNPTHTHSPGYELEANLQIALIFS
jgi:hypothetical protein